jgi:predicted nucleic acid-binding protein
MGLTMSGCLLDTGIVIAWERGKLDLSALSAYHAHYASSITVAELWLGAHLASRPEYRKRRMEFLDAWMKRTRLLDFSLPEAQAHAQISAELRARKIVIGAHDLLIAATALYHKLPVATLNVKEFSQVPRLKLLKI